jgi:hypothetical protein
VSLAARVRGVRLWLVLIAALAAFGAAIVGCEPATAPGAVVDPALYAFLSKARAAHHRADLAEKDGKRGEAIEAVSTVIDGPKPDVSPEVIEVVADARARRADLKSQAGDFDGAARDIDQGLAEAVEITHFRGHLYEVGGLVAERRATALEKSGDASGAAAAKDRAIGLYEKAIEVQDAVIVRALGGPDESVRKK